jgi:hypothetical protein
VTTPSRKTSDEKRFSDHVRRQVIKQVFAITWLGKQLSESLEGKEAKPGFVFYPSSQLKMFDGY